MAKFVERPSLALSSSRLSLTPSLPVKVTKAQTASKAITHHEMKLKLDKIIPI